MKKTKILCAMSGGVDSSVAAALMKSRGYDCVGCCMTLWGAPSSVDAARASAEAIGIPFVAVDMEREFYERVVCRFAREYADGRTPNPCVTCNREIKFGALLDAASAMGCAGIATGHYARVERRGGVTVLREAADKRKDQSYFLARVGQEALSRAHFPLGGMTKPEVRAAAESLSLPSAAAKDSQDICFVTGSYADIVERITGPSRPGDYVDTSGRVRGTHRGVIRCTVGQHRGLGLPGGEKLYVVRTDAERAQVVLGAESELYRGEIRAVDMSWTSGETPIGEVRCTAKIRYRHTGVDATVRTDADGAVVKFDTPMRAPTPGQTVVLQKGDIVLGGGTIV